MFRAYTFVRVFFVTSNAFFRQRFFRIYVVYCSCTRTVRVHVLLRTTKVRKYLRTFEGTFVLSYLLKQAKL